MPRTRDFFYIFIIFIIAIIFLAIAPSPALTPHGVFLPAPKNMLSKPISQLKPILPKDVRISTFAPNTLPIGTISIVSHAESLSKQAMKNDQLEIAAIAKKIAAEHGANYLQIISYQPPRSVDPLDGFNMILKAYRL
jgi:hypothetical protein